MWSIIVAAGWPIWPLIFASIIGLAIIFERVWFLRKTQLTPDGLAQDVARGLAQFKDPQNLTRLENHSPLGMVLAAGIAAHQLGRNASEAMSEAGQSVQTVLEKHLDVLAMIASAAPLMGLLGTVIGMIEIFAVQGSTSQSPEALASGIAVALYNTAFGLIVAIPALVAHRLLKIKINSLLDNLESTSKPVEQALAVSPTPRVKSA